MGSSAPLLSLPEAITSLKHGGVIAHATEGVIGLACNPRNEHAVRRVLAIKQRSAERGLILAAGTFGLLQPWLDWSMLSPTQQTTVQQSWPGAETWLIPAAAHVPTWVKGRHDTVAVRISSHPAIMALSQGLGEAIISTSANLSGQPAVSDLNDLSDAVATQIDGMFPSQCTQPGEPSRIRDARTFQMIRG